MSAIEQFFGSQRPPKTIINGANAAAATCTNIYSLSTSPAKPTLSGSMTAATLKTALSLTGQGTVSYVALRANDATARTVRLKITIDGVVVFDPGVSASNSTAGRGITAVGATISDGTSLQTGVVLHPMYYNSSFLVEIASSLTETDSLTFLSIYTTY
jgi:hypothetical protein